LIASASSSGFSQFNERQREAKASRSRVQTRSHVRSHHLQTQPESDPLTDGLHLHRDPYGDLAHNADSPGDGRDPQRGRGFITITPIDDLSGLTPADRTACEHGGLGAPDSNEKGAALKGGAWIQSLG
jgi:hypothetical protein